MLGIDPRDWPQISALLDEAMNLPPASRSAWLDALPAESAAYRDTLMRLLAADGGVETNAVFAAMPPVQLESVAADDGAAALAAGSHVGPYVLLSEIGQGGMGSVWLAERADGHPRRKVALKLPHVGWAPGLAERVERERDILASLEHPNIARLYDAGLDAMGRPYLALEYVEGTPIDRYAAERRLGVEERLRLLLQVAAAVAHAHAHLTVHRDLKPSNILVTTEGYVRLLDFGIGKLLEDGEGGESSELTRLHGQALTPDYASPEQIRGERVGTSSDVYSLGVVAYEVLAGDRPYRLGSRSARRLADAVDSVQVEPASRRASDPATRRALQGDLDAILNKALKKSPAERYATVQAFAADIERHLARQPVLARPDTLGYRARKYVTRHALPVSAAATVVVAIVAGAGAALWQAHAARLEAAHAEQEARRAEQVKRFALSIFEDADSEGGADAQTTAADLLKQAEPRVERELADRPDTEVEILTSIAYSLRGQGKIEDSARVAGRAVEIGRTKLGADAIRTLRAEVVWARASIDLGREESTVPALEHVVDVARRTGAQAPLADALLALSTVAFDSGKHPRAAELAREAVAVVSSHPTDFTKVAQANAWLMLAGKLRPTPKDGELDAALRGASLMRQAYGDKLVSPMLLARMYVAFARLDQGDVGAAVRDLEPLLADAQRLLGPDDRRVIFFAKNLADAQLDAGDAAAALDNYALALRLSKNDKGGRTLADVEQATAEAAIAAGRFGEALAHADSGLAVMAELKDADPADVRDLLSTKGLALLKLGRRDEAERALLQVTASAATPLEKAMVQGRLALVRSQQGRHDEAVALAQDSARALAGTRPLVRAQADRTLGATLLAAGRGAEAIAPLQNALEIYRKTETVVSLAQEATARDLERAHGR